MDRNRRVGAFLTQTLAGSALRDPEAAATSSTKETRSLISALTIERKQTHEPGLTLSLHVVKPAAFSLCSLPLCGPALGDSPFASASRILTVVSGVRSSCDTPTSDTPVSSFSPAPSCWLWRDHRAQPLTKKSSPTAIIGAFEHAPRHSTSTRVNLPSGVVWPGRMLRCDWIVSRIEVDPQPPSMHGEVVQSWMKFCEKERSGGG